MKFIGKIPFLIVSVLAWIVIVSSCANQGMPTGGPLDSLPPVIVNTQPAYRALNYKGREVRLTFNEYINSSRVLDALIISPPMEKRPTILTNSRTLIVRFGEDLTDDVTYSLDFQNGVVDNNENNPYEGLRFLFSTGSHYDSLRVEGHVFDGFNLDTPKDMLVMLHNNLSDSAVLTLRPNYIAKADSTGYFLMDNVASGHYNLFAISDQNNDLKYNEGTEGIAFFDSVIVPLAEYIEMVDTVVVNDSDSFLISGHTHFFPEPVFMRFFTETVFNQYIKTYTRSLKYKCDFVFNQPINDSFNVNLINNEFETWYLLEQNATMDSITLWITDTTLANRDTLLMEVSYFQLDTLKQPIIQKDTLKLNFTAQGGNPQPTRERPRDENENEEVKEILPVVQFALTTNTGSVFELNSDIEINSPEPFHEFDTTMIKLYLTADTLKTNLEYAIMQDSFRKYKISHKWEPETSYTLEIDSAAFTNIYGITSKKISNTFQTRDDNYYGQIVVNFSDVKSPIIAQLLRNDNNETVLRSKSISSDNTVTFDYLAPEKYILKIIYDDNNNGQWDSGSLKNKLQPERVAYHNEIVRVRSNWNNEIIWAVDENPEFIKNIIDAEVEAQKMREAQQQNQTN